MKSLVVLIFLTIPLIGLSQFEIYAGGNVSTLPNLSNRVEPNFSNPTVGFSTTEGGSPYTVKDTYSGQYGFDIGVGYRKSLSDRISLVSGLTFSAISYQRKSEVAYGDAGLGNILVGEIVTSDGQPLTGSLLGGPQSLVTEQTENVGETNLNYFAVPLAVEYKLFRRLGISIGLQASYLVHSSEVINQYVSSFSSDRFRVVGDEDPVIVVDYEDLLASGSTFELVEVEDTSRNGFNGLNVLAQFGVSYSIFEKISLTTQFSQGLSSVYGKEKEYAGNVRARFVSAGVRYAF